MRNRMTTDTWYVLVAAVLSSMLGLVSFFAFTASNTVPATKAGDGAGVITGYAASTVHYNLNAASPGNIDSVTFTLDSTPVAGSTIKAQVDSVGGTWYACTNAAANVTCNTTVGVQATVGPANQLRVIVAD